MSTRVPFQILKKPTATGHQGAKLGNGNALKAGIYADLSARNLDQRSKLAKVLRGVQCDLTNAIGGDPSPQQRILIDRAVYKLARITMFEVATLSGDKSNDEHYLAWSNSLRLDLQALGLERKTAPALDLKTYLSQTLNS